jgi:hypothetical protein
MDRYFSDLYKKMSSWETDRLNEEKQEYDKTGILPETNFHERIAEFRREDEPKKQEIAKRLEELRLEESPEDVGSGIKRSYEEDSSFENENKSRFSLPKSSN